MALVTVHFTRCVQDSHEFGATDECIVSRVFFTIESGGERTDGHADLKQTAGSDYLTGPIEVTPPMTWEGKAYHGPWNPSEFYKEVTAYYRACVLSTGILTLGPGVQTVRLYGSVFKFRRKITFEGEGSTETRWAVG